MTVRWSVALDERQASYSWYGGVQVTMRQATGPLQPISWWHCPYRKLLQQVLRWSQVPASAHRQRQLTHAVGQKLLPDEQPQPVQLPWQSMM